MNVSPTATNDRRRMTQAYVALAVARQLTQNSMESGTELELKSLLNVLTVTQDLFESVLHDAWRENYFDQWENINSPQEMNSELVM